MDLVEFAALKPGDKIENNAFGVNKGEVVGATAGGVRVVWGPRHGRETVFFYSVNTTAWMHWSKPEPEGMFPASIGEAVDRSA